MGGYLVPDNFIDNRPNGRDLNISSIFWGFSIALSLFIAGKAADQTWASYKRSGRVKIYPMLIWAEWAASTAMGSMTWFFLRRSFEPSLWFFLGVVVVWCIQIQCLLQIIINRVGLLMVVKAKATRMKYIVFFFLLAVNISVAVIWIPARLQLGEPYESVNHIWDPIEKALFLVIDAGLNFYFIYLVRSRLIANGLTKYNRLFRFNLFMVFISVSLDIALIGMMFMPNSWSYLQFHPVVYLLKLNIEMNMARLIGKVVRASNPRAENSSDNYASRTLGGASRSHGGTTAAAGRSGLSGGGRGGNRTFVGADPEADDIEMQRRRDDFGAGIHKTIHTEVTSKPLDDEFDDGDASESSSTRHLKEMHYPGV